MKPIFCGNFEYDARQSDLERLFKRYGKVDRVDMKSGFAFVYMEDERDAEDAIRALDRIEFGRKGRRLRVEWTKQERSSRRPESSRRPSSNSRPSKTLFVINFDPYETRSRDLERHFDPYGKILNVRIRRNFAFIQYENQEDATKALEATNMSKLLDRVITVEYAIRDDDERRNGYSPDGKRDRSPRRGYERVRSPSPYKRERGSPDYGQARGSSPSPYRRERASPDYARGANRSPSRKERETENGRGRSPRRDRVSEYDHRQSRSPSPRRGRESEQDCKPRMERQPEYDHRRSISPSPRRDREPEYERKPRMGRDPEYDIRESRSTSPRRERESEYDRKHSPSPGREREREKESEYEDKRSPIPKRERSNGDIDHGHYSGKTAHADYSRSPSPREPGERVDSPENFARAQGPYSDPESLPAE